MGVNKPGQNSCKGDEEFIKIGLYDRKIIKKRDRQIIKIGTCK